MSLYLNKLIKNKEQLYKIQYFETKAPRQYDKT